MAQIKCDSNGKVDCGSNRDRANPISINNNSQTSNGCYFSSLLIIHTYKYIFIFILVVRSVSLLILVISIFLRISIIANFFEIHIVHKQTTFSSYSND